MNFYGKQQPLSLNVGYKFDNGNELSVDFSKIKEDNQKSTTSTTVMVPGKVWQDKVQTIYNDNKRTDYAITYKAPMISRTGCSELINQYSIRTIRTRIIPV